MLPEVLGTKIPNTIWDNAAVERVLEYYAGPRLLFRKSHAGQLFLAWWSDSDETIERWVSLPVSAERLRNILSGQIASLDGLSNPEDGNLIVVDKQIESNLVVAATLATVEALPSDALPLAEARLNVPMPPEIDDIPSNDYAHRLSVRLESKPTDQTGRVSAKVVSQLTGNLQRLIDALGQAKEGNPTSRGSVPDSVRAQTQLDVVGSYSGSLGIRFESRAVDDLFGESLTRGSLDGLFELLEARNNLDELTAQLRTLKGRVAKNYKDFLSTIDVGIHLASLTWIGPRTNNPREALIDEQLARSIVAQIAVVEDSLQEEMVIEGNFIGGSLRTLRFEIQTRDSNERLTGTISDTARDGVEHITLGSPCRAVIWPELHIVEATGEERTTYTLMDITQHEDDVSDETQPEQMELFDS